MYLWFSLVANEEFQFGWDCNHVDLILPLIPNNRYVHCILRVYVRLKQRIIDTVFYFIPPVDSCLKLTLELGQYLAFPINSFL